jgi:hypothetical protein
MIMSKETIFKAMREEMPWAVIGEEKLKPYILEAMQIYAEEYHREQVKNIVNDVVGKTVRVIKEDRLDDSCAIEDHLRWHIGDEFLVVKIEIMPWGCFLYNKEGNNLNLKRAELVV